MSEFVQGTSARPLCRMSVGPTGKEAIYASRSPSINPPHPHRSRGLSLGGLVWDNPPCSRRRSRRQVRLGGLALVPMNKSSSKSVLPTRPSLSLHSKQSGQASCTIYLISTKIIIAASLPKTGK